MNNQRVTKYIVPSQIVLLSLLVALFVDIKPINMILVSGSSAVSEESGFMASLYPIIFILLVSCSFFYKKIKWHFTFQTIFLVIYLLLFYKYTQFFIGPPRTRFPLLVAFVLCAIIIPCIVNVDAKWFLRGLMFFPSFAIFRLNRVFSPVKGWTDAISMDTSYAFLIPIIATILYVKFYIKRDQRIKRIMWVLCLINAIYFFQLFQYGSRGPLLSIFLLLLFIFTIRKKENAPGISVSKGKLGSIFIILLVLLSSYLLFFQIFIDLFSLIGIESHALDKILILGEAGDVSNGRTYLNTLTINGIMEHPIFGYGFDRYHANTNMLYPHNFILQILYDGGIVYFIFILTPVVIGLIRRLRKCTYDDFIVITFLMFSSVPGALFSNNLYTSSILWLFFGCTLSNSFVYKSKPQI